MGEGADLIVPGLDNNPTLTISKSVIVQEMDIGGAGHEVETVAAVVIGLVVDQADAGREIDRKAIDAVVMGDGVGDCQIVGLLVRIEAVARDIHDLDLVDGDVVVEGCGIGFWSAVEAIDIARGGALVAVNRQAFNSDILGDFDCAIGVCAA